MSLDQLNCDMAEISIDPEQDSGWEEVIAKKSKNRSASSNAKAWGSSTVASNANAWGASAVTSNANAWGASAVTSNANAWGPPAVTSNANACGISAVTSSAKSKGWSNNNSKGERTNWGQAVDSRKPDAKNRRTFQTNRAIAPPLEHGWQWPARTGSQPKTEERSQVHAEHEADNLKSDDSLADDDDKDDDIDDEDDDDVDCLEDSDFDSDASQKSHDTRKKNKWLKQFFDALEDLTEEQISAPTRQWHCPACHDGPGAIDWYTGLQPLMTHAKTRGTRRVRLHREFAELLEEEVSRRGGSVFPAGEVFGKWRGLREKLADKDIVWPPIVVVMNTLLEKDENEKWIGMGNQELVDYFSNYAAVRARHSYGPNGHRGMSILMFESSAMGYLEAERLHKHFADEGRDKDAWLTKRVLFYPGGKRQLYGYLASKEDMDVFNQHSQGKSRLKFEIKSYLEMVVNPMRQMNEDNQKLNWYKNKAVKQEQRCKAYQESFEVVTQKLRETVEDNRIVRHRTKMQQEENKEEMDFQERFFKEQMERIHKAIDEKEQEFEKLLQKERAKAKQSGINIGTPEACKQSKEEIDRFISGQSKGVEDFVAEREKLVKLHEEKKIEIKHKYLEEEVKLEKDFDATLTKLMQKYAPCTFKSSNDIEKGELS